MIKFVFTGKIISIQPRIKLTRSFNESEPTCWEYSIMLDEGSLEFTE